ncbi:MAG: hypothetical protein A2Z91_02185 [Deltaproteobacteria bacterium GWA2_38_16]|nr:MAG: hypothetical protein A2Z91_02185 [Deltaproteobacteria bacterium GWA2_38_16]OGQ02005.1 MAG: hypothetical protein A3D19_08480 [Deltaproteobacteria bacterium RIFCSPHIGHO2_02_FULL_38_15]OGQ33697.1 MAG: hypothetical protein A3A72_05745 [Deltaproteobacteria bacterium RIFCSPLOWO2_01_FULL_38_9]OGQ61055.1 MAG: hypothetical protein A3G92_01950 [Deltaproteobacteria bacterium RIFCSPLOWO2_12_FULL_38_8]HBQ21538.1 hypothetical protein [Deltaproteobacteria bacterium]
MILSPLPEILKQASHSFLERLEQKTFPAHIEIIRQNERGDVCYVLLSGSVEVILREVSNDRVLATLGPGSVFGEAALLTGAPRNASVKTVEKSTVIILKRKELLELLGFDNTISSQIIELLTLRSRPKRLSNVDVEQYLEEGRTMTILKNPLTQAYYRLSSEGWFIWQLLDGKHHLKDLTLEYLAKFKTFAPHQIADVIAGLEAKGFLKKRFLKKDVTAIAFRMSWLQKIMLGIKRCLTATVIFKNVDPILTKIYNSGFKIFFTTKAFVVLTLFSISGIGIFILRWKSMMDLLKENASFSLPIVFGGVLLSFLIHEMAHAFATKSYGRKVYGMGFGWHWISPMVFVDTSDMWLLPKWPRMVVSLSGPYSHFVFSAVFAWIGGITGCVNCWIVALCSYVIGLINLNPLLELDMHYVISDYTDKPTVFTRALKYGISFLSLLLIFLCLKGVILTFWG